MASCAVKADMSLGFRLSFNASCSLHDLRKCFPFGGSSAVKRTPNARQTLSAAQVCQKEKLKASQAEGQLKGLSQEITMHAKP